MSNSDVTESVPRVGVIGAGFHASTNMLPALGLAGVGIAALATRSVVRSREALRRFGSEGTAYGSSAELLADDGVDAVLVVAQPADQLRLTLEAVAAGKHVFVDKPLGWNAAEARAVAQAADAAGRTVMVGFMKRYAPVYRQLEQLIDGGELGTVRSFSLRFACDSTPFCANEEQFLKLAAIHMVDLVRFLFGEVDTVSAVGSGGDPDGDESQNVALSITLGFASGVAGTLDLTGLPSRSSETENLVVTGDRGYATTSESTALALHISEPADAPTWQSLTERTTVFTPAESAMSGIGRDLHLRGFVGELAAFVDAVSTGSTPSSSAFDNVGTMDLCDRILASSATHRARRADARTTASTAAAALDQLEPLTFGEPGPFRDEMVARILTGRKTGSTTLAAAYALNGIPVPTVGERRALLDSTNTPVALIEYLAVAETTLDSITLDQASHESPSIDSWRAAHTAYFETLTESMRTHLNDPTWHATNPGPLITTIFRATPIV